MQPHRINGMLLRHWYLFPRSMDRLTDALFWPIIDIVIWTFLGSWMMNLSDAPQNLKIAMLLGIVFWRIVFVSKYEVSVNLLEECWNRNLRNLMATPLSKREWLFATLFVGVLKSIFVLIVCLATIALLTSTNGLSLGWVWIPAYCVLMVFGYALGFLSSSLVLHWGMRAQSCAWTLGFLLAPFCAVYFPVSVMPIWAQAVAFAFPPTYVCEVMRAVLMGQDVPVVGYLWKATVLSLCYFSLGLFLFNRMFEKARGKGFDSLE